MEYPDLLLGLISVDMDPDKDVRGFSELVANYLKDNLAMTVLDFEEPDNKNIELIAFIHEVQPELTYYYEMDKLNYEHVIKFL